MAVNYVKTYGDLSQEAQRQQRLAEMLQQQAQEPMPQYAYQGIQAMPSYANAIAKLLSSYGAERARRKAEETQQLAKKVGREEFTDYMTALQPTERKLGTALDVAAARPEDQRAAEMLPQNIDMGQVAQSIGAPTAGIAPQGAAPAFQAPQFAVGGAQMSPAQRRAKLLEGMGSDNPMIASVAQAEFAKKPEIAEFGTTPQFDEQGRGFVVNKAGDVRYLPGVKAPAAAPAAVTPTTIMKNGRKVVVDARTGTEIGLAPPDTQGVGSRETAEGLRKEFTSQTGKYREVVDAWQKIKSAAMNPSAANDIALVFSYMRALDPASTVREGEFATAQNAAGVPTQIVNAYNKLVSGERLSQPQRQDFLQSAYGLVESQMPNAQAIVGRYTDIAKRSGILPENVVEDPFKSARVPRLTGNNDPVYATLKSGDLFISPDGVMRRKK